MNQASAATTTFAPPSPSEPDPAGQDLLHRIDRLPPSRPIWSLILRLALGGWFEIYGLFLTAYAGPGLVKAGIFTPSTERLFDLHGLGAFVASLFLGVFIGTFGVSFIADRLGRRRVFVGALSAYTLASLLMSVQDNGYLILLCRTLAGVGLGAELVTIDSYIAELVPARVRGRSYAFVQAIQYTSLPVLGLLSWWLVPRTPLGFEGWRWVLWFGCLGALVVWIIRLTLPESPRWLISKGRLAEADTIVTALEIKIIRSTGRPLPDLAAPQIVPSVPPVRHELWRPPYRRRTIMLLAFNFFQSIGYYGFASWVPTLLAQKGISFTHSLLYSCIIAIAGPCGPLLAMLFADRIERKWLVSGAAASIALFGLVFAHQSDPVWLVLLGLLMTLASNSMTFSYRTYQAELFSNRIRARAVGLVYSISRVSGMLSGFSIAFVLKHFGVTGVFTLIAGCMAVVCVIIGAFGPRTLNRRLEDVSP